MESAKSDCTMKIDTKSKESTIQKPVRDSCAVMSNKKHDDTSIQGVHKDVFFSVESTSRNTFKMAVDVTRDLWFFKGVFFSKTSCFVSKTGL